MDLFTGKINQAVVRRKGMVMKATKRFFANLVTLTFITGMWAVAQCAVQAEQPMEQQNMKQQETITEPEPIATEILSAIVNQDSIKNAFQQPLTFIGVQRGTLAGLRGVCLNVDLSSPAPVFGLTKQSLQRDIELRLRTYGIKVLSEQNRLTSPDVALLQIKVDWQVIESLRVVYTTSRAYILQVAVLPRSEKFLCSFAITWDEHSGTVVKLDSLNKVHDNVHDVLDEFIKDYLAANQKEQLVGKEDKPKDN